MRYFVAGGAGFIGSHLVDRLLQDPETVGVVVFDALTYAGNPENLREALTDPRCDLVAQNIQDAPAVQEAMVGCDVVLNLAAETHVDRSIVDPLTFAKTNVIGTLILLEAARAARVRRYVQVSTDEVYGSIPGVAYATEDWPLFTASPYSASKAAGDHLTQSYHTTFGLNTVITRGSNTFGPRQYPEKLIPLSIARALAARPLPLYGDGTQIRDWLYVTDHAAGIQHAARHGRAGQIYNIAGSNPRQNRQVLTLLLDLLGQPHSLIHPVTDRPGHDQRYAIDAARLQSLGWSPRYSFRQGLLQTAAWYARRPKLLAATLAEDPFLQAQYAGRGGLS